MKQVDNLLHITNDLSTVKNIITQGFKPSYAVENLGGRKILIPMVSFSNLLFRDIGEEEVVDYGSYGVVINREFAVQNGLNPVIYIYENSIVDKSITNLLNLSLVPQTIDILKDITKGKGFTKITDYIKFNPLPKEVKELINSIDKHTDDNLILAIKKYAEEAHQNVYFQILLSKPYKVKNKNNQTRIAYNEREWRKGFLNLGIIFETKMSGEKNPEFEKWIGTDKPHFNEPKNILKIDIENITHLIVEKEREVSELTDFIKDEFSVKKIDNLLATESLKIGTLEKFKKSE
ncbi:Putative abortive phage resistance protein AbiGi, antitoxin [Arenibacter palladensis]|uniref:Putative abortive phage resistance protein AbiGi, antitoxin n=1 Tax=Arenibacter palladensis TaxID=237373 RepID=A0A1M4Y835_9FLAO|nr:abortive infection system antitoxin AbiGi family protein [Arenibacter palladensis]SHF01964.1 Putative abortive phage resistance protein AbiGi, antitoxin [Arenibacter palladensis]